MPQNASQVHAHILCRPLEAGRTELNLAPLRQSGYDQRDTSLGQRERILRVPSEVSGADGGGARLIPEEKT